MAPTRLKTFDLHFTVAYWRVIQPNHKAVPVIQNVVRNYVTIISTHSSLIRFHHVCAHTWLGQHDWAQNLLCPYTFVPTHVCAHTRLCPDTIVPRHVCAQTRLCPHTFVPTHVCAQTRLCPDTFVPIHDCARTHLGPDMFVPRHICAPTRSMARHDDVLGQ